MFRRLQLRLTFVYTLVLVIILVILNATIYLVLDSYNTNKLESDIEQILFDIKSSEWLREIYEESERKDGSYEYEDDSEEEDDDHASSEYETSSYEDYEIKITDKFDVIIPNAINAFSYYFIYSNDGELLRYKSPDAELNNQLHDISSELEIDQHPIITDLADKGYGIYIALKRPIIVDEQQVGYYTIFEDVTFAYSTLDNLKTIMIIMTIVGAFIALGIGYIFAGKAIKPINEAYKAKERFLGDASHELRTPISIIMLSMEALKRAVKKDNAEANELIEDVNQEALKMKGLVEKLLFIARNDEGTLVINKEDIDVSELIKRNVKKYKLLSSDRDIDFHVELSDGLRMQGDKKLIDSVISILIDNAVKYNKDNGKIYVSAGYTTLYDKKRYIHLRVQDTGIGIRQEDVNRIFERFTRQDESRSKAISGYGLGLAIAKEIALSHQGKISVESTEGQGSAFTVLLRC
ncbi:MAG: hypothetical protein JXN65_07575 [Clostridia bacterium]|nr:hypothetical protein [Clostridia bacterium]